MRKGEVSNVQKVFCFSSCRFANLLDKWRRDGKSRNEGGQNPEIAADKAIFAYAELYAFGESDNFSATGLSQSQGNEISAEVTKNILAIFKDYPLSERNISAIYLKYISKLKAVMNIQTKLKKKK